MYCPFISSVWDYVPTRSYLCRTRGSTAGVGFDQDGGDRVDPSPRDHQSNTCANAHLSGVDRKAHRSPRGDRRRAYLHQPSDRAIAIQRPREVGFLPFFWKTSGASDSNLTAQKASGRTSRSRCDRTAIAPRSHRDRAAITLLQRRNRIQMTGRSTTTMIRARSRRDRGPIVARSRRKSCLFSKQNWSSLSPNLKPQRRSVQTASTTPRFRAHDHLHRPRFRANFPL